MVTTPIRTQKEIEAMKTFFLAQKHYRDYALFVIGINTALRIGDLLALKWEDVYSSTERKYRRHMELREQKTGKKAIIALNSSCIKALRLWKRNSVCKAAQSYIFVSSEFPDRPISRNRAYHIIKNAAEKTHVEGNISCHSLRKTFGYHAWKRGTPSALIMNIYNHSSIEVTKRYLSICQDDKDDLYNSMNL